MTEHTSVGIVIHALLVLLSLLIHAYTTVIYFTGDIFPLKQCAIFDQVCVLSSEDLPPDVYIAFGTNVKGKQKLYYILKRSSS